MVNAYVKSYATSLIIREKQSKTTMTYHFTLVKMAIIKTQMITKTGKDVEQKGTSSQCWWEWKWVRSLWKT